MYKCRLMSRITTEKYVIEYRRKCKTKSTEIKRITAEKEKYAVENLAI